MGKRISKETYVFQRVRHLAEPDFNIQSLAGLQVFWVRSSAPSIPMSILQQHLCDFHNEQSPTFCRSYIHQISMFQLRMPTCFLSLRASRFSVRLQSTFVYIQMVQNAQTLDYQSWCQTQQSQLQLFVWRELNLIKLGLLVFLQSEIILKYYHNNLKNMEGIFQKLDSCKDLKDQMRHWCRQNGIKVSFTVNMTFTKSKAIYRKLENTYKKGYGKIKTRWLENQLKLFHFALLAVSVLSQAKISQFAQQQWELLIEAFPNKLQPILEYEAKNFTVNKNSLKQKWQEEEDQLLSQIVECKDEEPKWNEVATQLYIESERKFFRNGKQCRERWLNHLDTAIKHDKWTDAEDVILMRSVLECGKKWSRIMRCFNNQRTEHMIKNRFLSLILKCKKSHLFIQDEETAILKIAQEMGLKSEQSRAFEDELYSERKLRPKPASSGRRYSLDLDRESESQISYKVSLSNMAETDKIYNNKSHEVIIPQVIDPSNHTNFQCMKLSTTTTLPTASPTFLNPIPFINCGSLFPGFGYFQLCVGDFYNQLSSSSGFTAFQ